MAPLGTVVSRLRKLRGRSATELRVRGRQAVLARLEAWGLVSDARELSESALTRRLNADSPHTPTARLDAFRSGDASFYRGFADTSATAMLLRARAPDRVGMILQRATDIVDGRSAHLGLDGVRYGDPIDWHRDPRAPAAAPRVHWHRVPYLAWDTVGDHKTIWEVNRHQYFVELGQAYALTGDERYATTFGSHVESWIAANRAKVGINWASSLEVSFRAMSWIWALHFFRASDALTPALHSRVLGYLYLHARHIERYLSTYFSPNTHLTGEALGLCMLGHAFPCFRASARWRELGWSILEAESARQIRDDGVYFEQSTWYHRYTTDFYLQGIILRDAGGHAVDSAVRARCEAAVDHLMHVARPDGTMPLVGDDDGGRLTRLDPSDAGDVHPTLCTAAVVFGRGDFAAIAGDLALETAWLTGVDGVRRFDELDRVTPKMMSRGFPDGGYFTLRDRWDRTANWSLIDCGPHGATANNYGHAHADALALEVYAGGRPVLVDPGTYAYSGAERDTFRGTAAHNTVVVDGQSSSVPSAPFRWETAARSRSQVWVTHPRFDYFRGEHDGYARLHRPATHRRAVLFLKRRYWVVRDTVGSESPHDVELYWHSASGLVAVEQTGGVRLTEASDGRAVLGVQVLGGDGTLNLETGWVTARFGVRACAPVLRWHFADVRWLDVVTILAPPVGDDAVSAFVPVAAACGRAWVAAGADFEDVLTLSGESLGSQAGVGVSGAGLESDGRLVWLRRRGTEVTEFVVTDGGVLRVHGTELVRGPVRGWMTGVRIGGEWTIEAGDGRLS
jgi:hypothetical protein